MIGVIWKKTLDFMFTMCYNVNIKEREVIRYETKEVF